ncbi:MAG: hypothetical protein ACRDAT_08115 [Cetobacterium sp.]
MKNYIKLILTLVLALFLKENSSASDNREIIRAFEKGKPAKMDIEVTKVRSDNFIEFYIDKIEKKIYRDITQKTREIEDLEKKLYVTTYLKPNTKTNTIHDELPYEILTRNGRRYLEISYSKEPEKIYLWVLKKDKVQKLYTGIFKEYLNTRKVVETKKIEMWFNYNLNEENFFGIDKLGTIIDIESPNLSWYSGQMTSAWDNDNIGHLTYTIKIDNNNPFGGKSPKGNTSFTVASNGITFNHINRTSGYTFSFNPTSDFEKITIEYISAANNGSNTDAYSDTVIIYGKKNNFYLEKEDMDFGTFSKTEGKTAQSKIIAFNTDNVTYQLQIPNSINIKTGTNEEIRVDLTLTKDGNSTEINYINGVIPEPNSGNEYTEGSYTGTIPVTVIVTPKKRGGRF